MKKAADKEKVKKTSGKKKVRKGAASRLQALNRISRAFSSITTPDEILSETVELAAREMDADLVSVMIVEGDYLRIKAASGLPGWVMRSASLKIGEGISGWVAFSGEPLLVQDIDKHKGLKVRRSSGSYAGKSFICMPIKAKGKTIGVLNINSSQKRRKFTAADLEFLEIISSHAALALERNHNYEMMAKNREIERELELATMIQRSFLPDPEANIDLPPLYVKLIPAKLLSGDFYDYFELPDGKFVITVGDVSGKGVSSALFMAKIMSDLQSRIRFHGEIIPALKDVNRSILRRSRRGMFVTLLLIVLDKEKGRVTFVNAGHHPALVKPLGDGRLRKFDATGVPLGITADTEIQQQQAKLKPGDTIVLYTDGVIEARNTKGKEYGKRRLSSAIRKATDNPHSLGQEVIESINAFTGDASVHDDLTLLAVQWYPPGTKK